MVSLQVLLLLQESFIFYYHRPKSHREHTTDGQFIHCPACWRKPEHVFVYEAYDSGRYQDYLILNQDTKNCFREFVIMAIFKWFLIKEFNLKLL